MSKDIPASPSILIKIPVFKVFVSKNLRQLSSISCNTQKQFT